MAKIHTLKISNYRGIQKFEQVFGMTDFVCLIGRGDSGKTTILEAISAVLSPSWNLTFYDTDFYNGDILKTIEIEVSLYDLPKSLIQETKYGLFIRGLDKTTNIIHDKINDEHEPILTVKLIVDKNLEPKWFVINNRENQDQIEIKSTDRGSLNVFLVSDYLDRHFSWNKGNPLFSLLKNEDTNDEKTNVLLDAFREAKEKIGVNSFNHLDVVIKKIQSSALELGLDIKNTTTTIDFKDISIKDGRICLHEEKIPFRQKGKGSKRLISIAIQTELTQRGGILLIDEIEQGLEPDRVKHLVRILMKKKYGQIFLTTHSRDVIVELDADNLFLVNKNNLQLTKFGNVFQGCLRNNPEAFFSKKILVCEGATEVGICRALDEFRISKLEDSFSVLGIGIVDGSGSNFIKYCQDFKKTMLNVCAFCDSDDSGINSKKESLKSEGITIIDCDSNNAIENQIFNDLPWDAVKILIDYAIEEKGEISINDLVKTQFGNELPINWKDTENKEIRISLGKASTLKKEKKNGDFENKAWFKRIDHGEFLGNIICKNLNELQDKKLGQQIQALSNWIDNA